MFSPTNLDISPARHSFCLRPTDTYTKFSERSYGGLPQSQVIFSWGFTPTQLEQYSMRRYDDPIDPYWFILPFLPFNLNSNTFKIPCSCVVCNKTTTHKSWYLVLHEENKFFSAKFLEKSKLFSDIKIGLSKSNGDCHTALLWDNTLQPVTRHSATRTCLNPRWPTSQQRHGSLVWMLVKQGCDSLIRLVRTSVTVLLFQSLTSLL